MQMHSRFSFCLKVLPRTFKIHIISRRNFTMMKFIKRIFRTFAAALCCTALFAAAGTTIPTSAAAGDSEVRTTWKTGHTYYYNYPSGVFDASAMTVEYTKYNGATGDNLPYLVKGKKYIAWCATYGDPVPQVGDTYTLYHPGEHPYITATQYYDTGLVKADGTKGDWIDLNWAVSCVQAAQKLGYLGEGRTVIADDEKAGGRLAIELAIRYEKLGVGSTTVTNGYATPTGLSWLKAMGWQGSTDSNTVKNFYAKVKEIYTYAKAHPVSYSPTRPDPVVEEKITDPSKADWSKSDVLIATYTVKTDGAEIFTDNQNYSNGMKYTVSADKKTMTITCARDKLLEVANKGDKVTWMFGVGYQDQQYDVVYGIPKTYSANKPQNIMMYTDSSKSFYPMGSFEPKPQDEKGTITVQKTDSATGAVLPAMKFTLYKETSSGLTEVRQGDGATDANGKKSWVELDFGSYFLVEEANTGWKPSAPASWAVDGAVTATYTTKNGKSGWHIELYPYNGSVTVKAKNSRSEGSVKIKKLDQNGNPLAGVEFTLEQSPDGGELWYSPVKKITDANGIVEFTNLSGILTWRITETKTVDGMQLLKNPVWQGNPLTSDGKPIELTAKNAPQLEMPAAGSHDGIKLLVAALAVGVGGTALIVFSKKTKKSNS